MKEKTKFKQFSIYETPGPGGTYLNGPLKLMVVKDSPAMQIRIDTTLKNELPADYLLRFSMREPMNEGYVFYAGSEQYSADTLIVIGNIFAGMDVPWVFRFGYVLQGNEVLMVFVAGNDLPIGGTVKIASTMMRPYCYLDHEINIYKQH